MALSPELYDWQLEEDLWAADQWINAYKPAAAAPAQGSAEAPRSMLLDSPAPTPRQPSSRTGATLAGAVIWLVVSLSLATLVCGVVLIGWSCLAERADLWSIGLPLAFAGQAGLALGLMLQLDRLSQSQRRASSALDLLDAELAELRRSTALLTTTHSGAAQAFYAHMAEGASPHLLLADLKGQLDLLAMQMERQRRG